MIPRPDMLDDRSPSGLEVFQLTTEPIPSAHVYMEAQVFTPDSKRLILHRSAHAHAGAADDSQHKFLICDLENKGKLIPITEEGGATAPSLSPDGKCLYYFVNKTRIGGGTLLLRRVRLDGTQRETIFTLDTPIPGTRRYLTRPYGLSTISSDGRRIAISGFLGDGTKENAHWGLLVFDIARATVDLIIRGRSWCNVHPQYCRSLDPEARRDILIQENHGNRCDATGKNLLLTGGAGADIHVIRDDGTRRRNLPWGRDGNEFCQGHQCWRGRSNRAITSTFMRSAVPECRLIESVPIPYAGNVGLKSPRGRRNDLTRHFPNPQFWHFATDIAGKRLISDSRAPGADTGAGGELYVATFSGKEGGPLENFVRLLKLSRNCAAKQVHPHPFLSPDGKTGFFNSDESGILQAYMVRGF